jgi:hypothetical protein
MAYMFEMEVVKAWNAAIAREENWKPTGPRWTFIDSDMYMDVMPAIATGHRANTNTFYNLFNDLADSFSRSYPNGISFAEWTADRTKIDAEHRELFGVEELA